VVASLLSGLSIVARLCRRKWCGASAFDAAKQDNTGAINFDDRKARPETAAARRQRYQQWKLELNIDQIAHGRSAAPPG
jgi:hypothetical protein